MVQASLMGKLLIILFLFPQLCCENYNMAETNGKSTGFQGTNRKRFCQGVNSSELFIISIGSLFFVRLFVYKLTMFKESSFTALKVMQFYYFILAGAFVLLITLLRRQNSDWEFHISTTLRLLLNLGILYKGQQATDISQS